EEEQEKLEKESKPVRNKMGLVELGERRQDEVENVSDYSFSDSGRYLAILKYPEESSRENNSADSDAEKPVSSGLVVRVLASGALVHLGNISGYSWQDGGDLLALTVEARDRDGNAVQLFNPGSGSLTVLDSEKATYSGLSWREESADLAVYRSRSETGREGETQSLLAWRGLDGEPVQFVFAQTEFDSFPSNSRVSNSAELEWSKDGRLLFFTIQDWREEEPVKASPDAPGKGTDTAEAASAEDEEEVVQEETGSEVEVSDVQIWHARDERTIPMQEKQKKRDKDRGYRSVWNLDGKRFDRLGTDLMEEVVPLPGGRFATETDRKPYLFENMFDYTREDVSLIEIETGNRQKVIEEVWYFQGASPGGRYLLFFKGGNFRTYDVERRVESCLTCDIESSFVDEDYDVPVRKGKPPWGMGGWLNEDQAVLLYDRFDIWAVRPDASESFRLTRGREEELVHRYVQLDEEQDSIDPGQPLFVSAFGYWSKQEGYVRIDLGQGLLHPQVEPLILKDKEVSGLIKAKNADVYAYVQGAFDDSPDYFAGGEELGEAPQITRTNPFQENFEWGRAELIDYENRDGKRLQGALYYPAGYDPGKTYPMIVYVYERLSNYLHNYVVPTERRPYNSAVFTSQGYFVLTPDIVYEGRNPGISALDCVSAAVKKALENQAIDGAKVGLVGHSWGGYEASFIPTQTDLFAASIAGAPITNFFSFYGTFHWGPGMPESQHFETGQARMDVPYWEDMEAYIRNSPVLSIDRLDTPMMLFFGDKDSVVDWHQGVEMYNYARRAGKNLVMLVYPGEDHGARKKENQIDYHRRVLAWFDHYLKGSEAPAWITEGISALERERFLEENRK
ncbi:MAG: S9 family peptidase, partial [Acidobacteriota bacterium]